MIPPDTSSDGEGFWRRLSIRAVWLCAIAVALHPVSYPGLWWELSKGRVAADGLGNPTATLIAGSGGRDACWLSGLPTFLVFGEFGGSGLMAVKLAAVLLVTGLLLRRVSPPTLASDSTTTSALIPLTLLAARTAWDPSPLLYDLLGCVAVFLVTDRASTARSPWRLMAALLCLTVWANLGQRPLVGVAVLLERRVRRPEDAVPTAGVAVLALLACCLTPSGFQTLPDSLALTIPQTIERGEILRMAGWHPWWERGATVETVAWIVLSGISLLIIHRRPRTKAVFVLILAQALATAASENVPLAAVWLTLALTTPSRIGPLTPEVGLAEDETDHSPTLAPTDPATATAAGSAIPESRRHPLAAAAILCCAGLATLPGEGCDSGLGWGLDPSLDSEAFAASVNQVPLEGVAHCVGLREAGLLSWHASAKVKPYDTPTTALLARRLRQHVLLTSDLTAGWQVRHPRADGSSGGWWSTAQNLRLTALVVPSESVDLVAALEPTIWKPLSLTAVSLVYGRTGDPGTTPKIVEALSLRPLVDRGPWTYQSTVENATGPIDFLPWQHASALRSRSLRLARLFRAMGLSVGAMKVLHAMGENSSPELLSEFHENQLRLGYQERILCGRSSSFRLRAALLTASHATDGPAPGVVLNWPSDAEAVGAPGFQKAVAAYIKGDLKSTFSLLDQSAPEPLYARALLVLEVGDPRSAEACLQDFLKRFPEHRLRAAAESLLASLAL